MARNDASYAAVCVLTTTTRTNIEKFHLAWLGNGGLGENVVGISGNTSVHDLCLIWLGAPAFTDALSGLWFME